MPCVYNNSNVYGDMRIDNPNADIMKSTDCPKNVAEHNAETTSDDVDTTCTKGV